MKNYSEKLESTMKGNQYESKMISKILGRKIIQPMMAETIATTSTAAAARSFTCFAVSLMSGESKSVFTS